MRIFYDPTPGRRSRRILSVLDLAEYAGRPVPVRAIVGWVDGTELSPATFEPNPLFHALLHETVAAAGPDDPALAEAAAARGEGWVFVVDRRTPDPWGTIPPEDTIGAFRVEKGRIVRGSYRSGPRHRLVTKRGPFVLDRFLAAALTEAVRRVVREG